MARNKAFAFILDFLEAIAIVGVIVAAFYLYSGTWPPLVSVNGISMNPNMENGDLVLIQALSRGDVQNGDVIVYRPYGNTSRPYVIHRAMRWVDEGDLMWPGGPEAPTSGYMTLGDNNHGVYDQQADICYMQPVEKQWVMGIIKFRVPYLGYVRQLLG